MRRGVRWGVVVAALAVVVGCTPPPEDPAFAAPPPVDVVLVPGDIVRARPWVFTQDPINRTPVAGVRVEQVLYRSTNAMGAPMDVTGTVMVPTAPWKGPGPRPLVSYGVGTRGVGDACAPSASLASGLDYESAFILPMLERGWAVAVTDMEGLGTPGDHTYQVGRSQGTAVLDMARAALRLPGSGLGPDTPVGVMGYSQGGSSAGWAAELAHTYAPELNLVGVAAGGVPADLEVVAEAAEGGPFIGLVLIAALGLDTAYPELDLERFVNDRGRSLLERGRRLCLVSFDGIATFAEVASSFTSDYVESVNPLRTPAWQARLRENRLGSDTPKVPVLMQHGLFDQIIPFGQAEQLRRTWCAGGANLTWRVFPIAEHVIGGILHRVPAIDFLEDRFAGRSVRSNCSVAFPL